MKVKDLIAQLQKVDSEATVVLSVDEEGNGFNPLCKVDTNYKFDNGDIGLKTLTPELIESGYTEDDVKEEGIDCIILWP